MSSDREETATDVDPTVAASEMDRATSRLRSLGWQIAAVTEAPIIDEGQLRADAPADGSAGARGDDGGIQVRA